MPFPPYATVPVPRTWSAGPILTSALRGDVTNAVNFLANRPFFVGQQTTGASIASGGDVSVGMNVELVDTWAGHAQNIDINKYWCQAPGWYLCQGTAPFAYTTATQALFAAGLNSQNNGSATGAIRGQLQLMGSGRNPSPQVCDLVQMTVTGPPGGSGDWVQLTALQTTGSSQAYAATAAKFPYISVRWVAALSGTVGLAVPSNDAWVTPSSFVTSAFLNKNIRDTIGFLTYPPIYRAHYAAGTTTLANGVFPAGTVIALNTIDVDNYSGGTTGASAAYTAPRAGQYFCYGQIALAGTTATNVAYSCGLSVNGGTTQWGSSVFQATSSAATGAGAVVRKRLRLAAGDTVQLMGQQSSGAALAYNGTAANQTRFLAVWEGS